MQDDGTTGCTDYQRFAMCGKELLEKNEESNLKAFRAYQAIPGNEGKTGASSLNGGNRYGNVLQHAVNFCAYYTLKTQTPVYRGIRFAAASPAASPSDSNEERPKWLDTSTFIQADEGTKLRIHRKFLEFLHHSNNPEELEHMCIGYLAESGFV